MMKPFHKNRDADADFIRVAACSPLVNVAHPNINATSIVEMAHEVARRGADLMVFPELSVSGYTCGDLFLHPDLLLESRAALEWIVEETSGMDSVVICGLPVSTPQGILNAAAVIHGGVIHAFIPKTYLINEAEYYERRWFAVLPEYETYSIEIAGGSVPITGNHIFQFSRKPGATFGVEICEDLWAPIPRSSFLALAGATIIVNLSASNEVIGKREYRRLLATAQSGRLHAAYVYASAGPGESTTDTVFSGHCMIIEDGHVMAENHGLSSKADYIIADIDTDYLTGERNASSSFRDSTEKHKEPTLVTGVNVSAKNLDHLIRKVSPNPFIPEVGEADRRCLEIMSIQAHALAARLTRSKSPRPVVGVSGGLDSTLALLVSLQAVNMNGGMPKDVVAVRMPGQATSKRTSDNGQRLAELLGCTDIEIPIGDAVDMHLKDIGFNENWSAVTIENAQARERTQILMDIANGVGGLVVGTSDMSEIALGWSTYGGDHMSMYSVNAGIPKTLVKFVVDWYGRTQTEQPLTEIIADVVNTPISPELSGGGADTITQRTEDIIGPYELHDFFLFHLIRRRSSVRRTLVLSTHCFGDRYDKATIIKWLSLFLQRFAGQQFKRSCSPDSVKVGTVSLSPRTDWRMPSDLGVGIWQSGLDI